MVMRMKTRFQFLSTFLLGLVLLSRTAIAISAHVTLNQNGTNFSYTLFNEAPANSPEFLNVLHLNPTGPFQVSSTPAGWAFVTDYTSYIDWFCINPLSANPNDVAPASSLPGFTLTSITTNTAPSGYALTSWYRGLTGNGGLVEDIIPVPSILSFPSGVTNVAHTPATFQFTVLGIPTFNYIIQTSPNLTTWTDLATNLAPFTFIDTNVALFPRRFYRATSDFDLSSISGD